MVDRRSSKSIFCIEGEVEIGFEKAIIEDYVPKMERYVAAYSEAQARWIFQEKFSKYFANRFVLFDAHVFRVNRRVAQSPRSQAIENQLALPL